MKVKTRLWNSQPAALKTKVLEQESDDKETAAAAEEREGRALEVEEVVEPLGTDYGFSAPRSSSAPEPSGAQARSPASSVPSPLYPEPSSFSSLVH